MKKIFSVLLVILVLAGCSFVLAGCGTGARQPLDPAPDQNALVNEAKAEIDTFVESLNESAYTAGNWAAILQYALDGKAAIDAATDKTGVDTVKEVAVTAITEVKKIYSEKIYSHATIDDNFDGRAVIVVLDKAISGINKRHEVSFFGEIGIIAIEDLMVVTDISTVVDKENWEQVLLLTLSQDSKENVLRVISHLEQIDGIKYAGPNRYLSLETDHGAQYDSPCGDGSLNKFYGLYNGAAVFFVAGDSCAIKTAIISGVEFSYSYGWTILVWKDGASYDLENTEALFNAGILTQRDIEQIGIIHAKAHANQ